jgi:hypothetical protein
MLVLFALQSVELWIGIVLAIALAAGLLIPYLYEEIEEGKVDPGPTLPTGAGDIHPGTIRNPVPDQAPVQSPHDAGPTLSLGAFHTFVIWAAIVLSAGTAVWGFFNGAVMLGTLAFAFALLVLAYGGYFAGKVTGAHLR